MRDFFKAYKEYIIKHSNKFEYKPTSGDKFDACKLFDVSKRVDANIPSSIDDCYAIEHFVEISQYIHDLYVELYKCVKDNFNHLNLKGSDVAEYIIAGLNREYKVIWNKTKDAIKCAGEGSYFLSDMMNVKMQSPVPEIGLVDVRACLESATDSCSLLLNYLRHLLNEKFSSDDVNPDQFASRIINSIDISQMVVVLKHSYDDILYNDGYVYKDDQNHLVTFDYECHENLKLLLSGNLMFSERRMYKMDQSLKSGISPRLYKYITNYRIKKARVIKSCITFDFGQGEPKEHKNVVSDIQSAVDSYYEFLVGDTLLPNFSNSTIDEAISVWCAIQYMAMYISDHINFDVSIKKREDYDSVPSKMLKLDLINYVVKLTGIKINKVRSIVVALEANWKKYNDIWTCMLYPVGEYYLLPFYPLIYSSPYNVIDQLLHKGGFNLDDRGSQFEKYLYGQFANKTSSYPINCMPTGKYGDKGNEEEIDVLISMKNVVLVADAKCIHYSVEPMNYAEAWDRLKEGCEQAVRKAEFVKNNPKYFSQLGDYSKKKFIPFVITNYPTFVGFCHKGAYVIDAHSLIAYLHCGYMTIRQLTKDDNDILGIRWLYNNEDQFSDNFEKFLSNNPIKQEFLNRIYIHDLPLTRGTSQWRFISKSAQLKNNPKFNIQN